MRHRPTPSQYLLRLSLMRVMGVEPIRSTILTVGGAELLAIGVEIIIDPIETASAS